MACSNPNCHVCARVGAPPKDGFKKKTVKEILADSAASFVPRSGKRISDLERQMVLNHTKR